jgi:hypothetical protein
MVEMRETEMDIQLLDVVALLEDTPQLLRGQVGTVVEILDPDARVFEIEFSDDRGVPYAILPLRADQLIVLHYSLEPSQRA